MENVILMTDAYKETHWNQYPKNTQVIYSYLESRGGKFPNTLFFGLQAYLKKYLVGEVLTSDMIEEAKDFCGKVFGTDKYFNIDGWNSLLDTWDGIIPLRIKAIPEGTIVPIHNALITVENMDYNYSWLTNFFESLLLQGVWYSTTVATLSWQIKQLIKKYANLTGGECGMFHLNDFGFRGVSSKESAGMGGMAHLINFLGTDNLEGIKYAMDYYNADVCGYSVSATEHSTTTIYGQENEGNALGHFIDSYPTGILSLVIDSYDSQNTVDNIIGNFLKDKILKRDGRVVVRPDSGHPPTMAVQCLESLSKNFGYTVNKAGYKVLNPKVGVIYGDGINYESIEEILIAVKAANFAIDPNNLVFGMGGALLQQINRDTQKFAFKCSSAKVDGVWRDVFKQPKTDSGKNSMRGRFKVIEKEGVLITVGEDVVGEDKLCTVFENGELTKEFSFDEIKNNSNK